MVSFMPADDEGDFEVEEVVDEVAVNLVGGSTRTFYLLKWKVRRRTQLVG